MDILKGKFPEIVDTEIVNQINHQLTIDKVNSLTHIRYLKTIRSTAMIQNRETNKKWRDKVSNYLEPNPVTIVFIVLKVINISSQNEKFLI